jgi:hypothetical protein
MTIAQSKSEHLRFRMTARLEALRAELALGERRLAALELERRDMHDTLLRISGATQILEEQLAADEAALDKVDTPA